MTNPLGHLYSGRLPDPPERFPHEPGDDLAPKKGKGKKSGFSPASVVDAALVGHPVALPAAVLTAGLLGLVLAVVRWRRRSR